MQKTIALSLLLLATTLQAAVTPEPLTRVCTVTLSYEKADRTLEHVLAILDEVAEQRVQIVCLPAECVPTNGGSAAQTALQAIATKARARRIFIASGLLEKDGPKVYSTTRASRWAGAL